MGWFPNLPITSKEEPGEKEKAEPKGCSTIARSESEPGNHSVAPIPTWKVVVGKFWPFQKFQWGEGQREYSVVLGAYSWLYTRNHCWQSSRDHMECWRLKHLDYLAVPPKSQSLTSWYSYRLGALSLPHPLELTHLV